MGFSSFIYEILRIKPSLRICNFWSHWWHYDMFMSMLDKKQSNVNFFSKAMLDGTLCGTMIMLKKNWSHQPFDVHFFFPDDLLTS